MIKNCCCIQPPEFNLEDMNAQIRHWFGAVGWSVQLLGGTFRQESDYPTLFITFDCVYLNMTTFIRVCIFCLSEGSNLKVFVTTHLRKSGNHKRTFMP